eukprot:5331694-Amphidinium_carterae.1
MSHDDQTQLKNCSIHKSLAALAILLCKQGPATPSSDPSPGFVLLSLDPQGQAKLSIQTPTVSND